MKQLLNLIALVIIIEVALAFTNTFEPYHLFKLKSYPEAKCLDGSPPAYYFSKASSLNSQKKFIIFLEGGGWCGDDTLELTLENCYNRSFTILGTSKGLSSVWGDQGGIKSGNSQMNPFFYDWNRVDVLYCDGAGRQGYSIDPYIFNDTKLWFRGMNNTISLFQDLIKRFKINKADEIILTGNSAGGLAVYTWANYLRSIIPSQVKVWAVSDSGFFLDYQNIYTKDFKYRIQLQNLMYYANRDGDPVITECVNDNPNEKWKCLFAQYMQKYVTVPLFLTQFEYDTWQLQNILGESCFNNFNLNTCNTSQNENVEMMRYFSMQFIIDSLQTNKNRGAFIAACLGHCLIDQNGIFFSKNYAVFENTINNPSYVIYKWINQINDTNNWTYIDPLPWPSNYPCSNIEKQTEKISIFEKLFNIF